MSKPRVEITREMRAAKVCCTTHLVEEEDEAEAEEEVSKGEEVSQEEEDEEEEAPAMEVDPSRFGMEEMEAEAKFQLTQVEEVQAEHHAAKPQLEEEQVGAGVLAALLANPDFVVKNQAILDLLQSERGMVANFCHIHLHDMR